jgi:hypothetical protein
MVEWVFLAGVPVQSSLVLELATLVRDPGLVDKLERAVELDLIVIRLTDDERTTVLKALTSPPVGLEEVRETLLEEESRRAAVVGGQRAAGTAA